MPLLHGSEIKEGRQSAAERLQEFSIDLSRLVRLAFPRALEDVLESTVVDAVPDGVRDQELQHFLKLPKSITA